MSMIKNPQTKMVVNNDTTHYELSKLRRQQKQKEKYITKELEEIKLDLKEIKILVKQLAQEVLANG